MPKKTTETGRKAERAVSVLIHGMQRKPLPPAGSMVLDAERGGFFPAEDYWPGGRFD